MIMEYPYFDFDPVDFVTSDTHFGHARISELAARPFKAAVEMDAALARVWNDTVGPDDIVLHLGDLALGPIEASIAFTAGLNGRRYLVPGNHDRVSPATQSKRAIERFTAAYVRARTMLYRVQDNPWWEPAREYARTRASSDRNASVAS